MASSEQNLAIVEAIYAAFLIGKVDDLLTLLDEHVKWCVPDMPHVPYAGCRFGRDGVREFLGLLTASQTNVAFARECKLANAEKVCVLGHYTWDVVATHEFAAALSTALDQVFPADPPTFVAAVPHGYPDPAVVVSDIRSAGFDEVSLETITLRSPPASAADVAVGFCTGTPLRAAIEARADLASTTEQVADVMQGLLGTDPVTARMTAHVIQTTSL